MTAHSSARDTRMEQQVCQQHLKALLGTAEIDGALVSTVDGFELAAALRDPVSPQKLAAMGSSLLALAEAITQEGGVGQCRDLVIDGEDGRVLLMGVAGGSQRLMLTVLCSARATLGGVLWAAREAREAIGRDLQGGAAGDLRAQQA